MLEGSDAERRIGKAIARGAVSAEILVRLGTVQQLLAAVP